MVDVMNATYDLSGFISSTNLGDAGVATNAVLGGYWFGYMILIIVFLITFINLKLRGYTSGNSFVSAAWLLTITALFVKSLGLIDNWVFWGCVLLTPIAMAMIYLAGYDTV